MLPSGPPQAADRDDLADVAARRESAVFQNDALTQNREAVLLERVDRAHHLAADRDLAGRQRPDPTMGQDLHDVTEAKVARRSRQVVDRHADRGGERHVEVVDHDAAEPADRPDHAGPPDAAVLSQSLEPDSRA